MDRTNQQYLALIRLAESLPDWTAEPGEDERVPGTTITIKTGSGQTLRSRMPAKVSDQTVTTLRNQLTRAGFDERVAKKIQRDLHRRANEKEEAELAAKEQATKAAIKPRRGDKPRATGPKKKYPELRAQLVLVSPSYAQALMDDPGQRTHWRDLSPDNVSRFETMIEDDEMLPTVIQIDWFGFVGNGRHRLQALINVGRDVVLTLLWGVDPALYDVEDTPKVRTAGDSLKSAGLIPDDLKKDDIARALRALKQYKDGELPTSGGHKRVENRVVTKFAEEFPGINDAARIAVDLFSSGGTPGKVRFKRTPAIVFVYLALEALPGCEAKLKEFIDGVTIMDNVKARSGDPRAAGHFFMNSVREGEKGGNPLTNPQQLSLLTVLWNAFVKGTSLKAVSQMHLNRNDAFVTAEDIS